MDRTNDVPGKLSEQSVFRSELVGVYAMITLVHLLVEYYDVRYGTKQLVCNGIHALEYVFDTKNRLQKQTAIMT